VALGSLAAAKTDHPLLQHAAVAAAQGTQGGSQITQPQVTPLNLPCCPVCTKLGHVCPNCERLALAIMAPIASRACGNCTPDKLCENCCTAVDAAIAQLPQLEAGTAMVPDIPCVYTAGKLKDDRSGLVMATVSAAMKQGLGGDGVTPGSIYPDAMTNGLTPDSPVYAIFGPIAGKTPSSPLMSYTIPAGMYLQFQHHGSYDTMAETWLAAFAYCHLHNLKLGTGPCGEDYVNDPSTTPADQLLTNLYVPLAEMPQTS
jgi:effector-binding domain-containing protein